MFLVFVKQRVASASARVRQRGGVAGLQIRVNPVVDALAAHAEHARNLGGRRALIVFEDGHKAPKEVRIVGGRAVLAQPLSLPGSQMEPAHVLVLHR